MSLESGAPVIVGYREGDRRIPLLWEEYGRRALPHKGCMNCGQMTYFVESGQDAIRTRDAQPVCDDCWNEPDVKDAIYREL
jgi:hypothetical protein